MKFRYQLVFSLSALIFIGFSFSALASFEAEGISEESMVIISAYQQYKEIDGLSLIVPTVVEVPFDIDFLERFDFAVYDKTKDVFEPFLFRKETNIPFLVDEYGEVMTDSDFSTYAEFALPEDAHGEVRLTLTSDDPITSSGLTVLLDNHVALPTSVTVRAGEKILLSDFEMKGSTLRFPEATSNIWIVDFEYAQPLRITELRMLQNHGKDVVFQSLRFLAQPDHAYRVYFNPDRHVKVPTGESGNLSVDKDVLVLSQKPSFENVSYIKADVDEDGVPDVSDNCVSILNVDQLDENGNGRGDACDDFDKDGIINSEDNCVNYPNRLQQDDDGDGIGNPCDDEESRITERYIWLPWVGIGFAAFVLFFLFASTFRSMKK